MILTDITVPLSLNDILEGVDARRENAARVEACKADLRERIAARLNSEIPQVRKAQQEAQR